MLNLCSLYFIAIGLYSLNRIETYILVSATAVTDESVDSSDVTRIYLGKGRCASLTFSLPLYFPERRFFVKTHLPSSGRRGCWHVIHNGDAVPLWVNIREPDTHFWVNCKEKLSVGSTYTTSVMQELTLALIGFLLSGCGVVYCFWRRRVLLDFFILSLCIWSRPVSTR